MPGGLLDQRVEMLLYRWAILAQWAALQEIYTYASDDENDLIPPPIDAIKTEPLKQIEIIKDLIIKMVPKTKFIKPKFEFAPDLPVEDFVELYIKHQNISIKKTIETIRKLEIQ